MRNFKINPDARLAVKLRSRGICEACGFFEAVHVHHLTYARAGYELPEDLLHICTFCHCAAHPEKYQEILKWEAMRRLKPKTYSRDSQKEDDREREEQHARNEPAWNLGRYVSSGYDHEEVTNEDGFQE